MRSWIGFAFVSRSDIADGRSAEGGPLSATARLDAVEGDGDGRGGMVIALASLVLLGSRHRRGGQTRSSRGM